MRLRPVRGIGDVRDGGHRVRGLGIAGYDDLLGESVGIEWSEHRTLRQS